MKIEITSGESIKIENGDYTYFFNFSFQGEPSLLRFLTNSDDKDLSIPQINWNDGNDTIEIETTSQRIYEQWVREC